MAHIFNDEEAKSLEGIKMLTEGEMKENFMDTFFQTMLKKQVSTSNPTRYYPKALFFDAPYEKNTKSFQRNHQ